MINYLTQGIASTQNIAENPDFSGGTLCKSLRGMASHLVLGKLVCLAGADMVVYPIESGKYRLLDEHYRQIAFDLVLDWHNIKRTFPIPAGGVHQGLRLRS